MSRKGEPSGNLGQGWPKANFSKLQLRVMSKPFGCFAICHGVSLQDRVLPP
jgi:hypothetical protein